MALNETYLILLLVTNDDQSMWHMRCNYAAVNQKPLRTIQAMTSWYWNAFCITGSQVAIEWPFVRGIHRLPVDSPHRGSECAPFVFSPLLDWKSCWSNTGVSADLRRRDANLTSLCYHRSSHWILLLQVKVTEWISGEAWCRDISSMHDNHSRVFLQTVEIGHSQIGFTMAIWVRWY